MTTTPTETEAGRSAPVDPMDFRHVMSHLPTGVVALSGLDTLTQEPAGLIVGTFQSLSIDPPLATFSISRASNSWLRIRSGGRFSASVLADDQGNVATALSGRSSEKFDGVAWHASPDGAPHIDGAVAWIDCEAVREIDGGDHVFVIARALRMSAGFGEPLIFHKGVLGGFRAPVAA